MELYTEKWIAKERKKLRGNIDIGCLDSWKDEIMDIVENKIRLGKVRYGKTWTMRIEGALKTELDRLKDKFVITVTDKAQNNILFTCKYFYIQKVKEELNIVADRRLTSVTVFDRERGQSPTSEVGDSFIFGLQETGDRRFYLSKQNLIFSKSFHNILCSFY